MEQAKFNIEALADLDHLTAETKAAAQSIITSFPGIFGPSAPNNDIATAVEIGLTLPDSKTKGDLGENLYQLTITNPLLTTIGFPLDTLTLRFITYDYDRGRWSLDAHIKNAKDDPYQALSLGWNTTHLGCTRRNINDWLEVGYYLHHDFFPPIHYRIRIDHDGVRQIQSLSSSYFPQYDRLPCTNPPQAEDYGPLRIVQPSIQTRDNNLAFIHFDPSPSYQGAGHLGEVNLLVPVELEMVRS